MTAPNFEFVVEGPAVPLRAAKKDAKRYQAWKKKVREEASKLWLSNTPVLQDVTVIITNYFSEEPPDVDNIIKPILDGLNGIVYGDDFQVQTVTSRKFVLIDAKEAEPEMLTNALKRFTEVIHIEVYWETVP